MVFAIAAYCSNQRFWGVGIIIIVVLLLLFVSCHRPFHPGTSPQPTMIPTAQASSFRLQYFPYYL
jgi:hypothetical protein